MRADYRKSFPEAMQAMVGMEEAVHKSSIEPEVLELVKIRASQINGCAFCLDMHTKDARARGESEQRINVLPAWRETDFFNDRERAALAWCESVTRLSELGSPDDDIYADVAAQFNEDEIVALTLAVLAINGWNTFNVALNGTPPGHYVSPYAKDKEPANA